MITIHELTDATYVENGEHLAIQLQPGQYEGAVFLRPNFEIEVVSVIANGRQCSFERDALLCRRAVGPARDGRDPVCESPGPVTNAEFIHNALQYFGEADIDAVTFWARTYL
jgi:hypothetical protein